MSLPLISCAANWPVNPVAIIVTTNANVIFSVFIFLRFNFYTNRCGAKREVIQISSAPNATSDYLLFLKYIFDTYSNTSIMVSVPAKLVNIFKETSAPSSRFGGNTENRSTKKPAITTMAL